MAIWKKNRYQPEQLVAKIEEYRQSNRLGYRFFDIEVRTLLGSMIEFDRALPELEKIRIIGAALRQIATGPAVTAGIVLGTIGRLEHTFLTKESSPYVLATTLSVHRSLILPRRSVDGASLTATPHFPSKFQTARNSLFPHTKPLQLPTPPDGYQAIRVHLHARSPAEAAQLALDKLDLLRAIWNLYLQNGRFKVTDGRRNDRYLTRCV